MSPLARTIAFAALLACAGCSKPADLSSSRRDFMLARPHGWIDLVAHAPKHVDGDPPAGRACFFHLDAAGETLAEEGSDLAAADAARAVRGYRVLAPAGALALTWVVSGCVKDERRVTLPLQLEQDHLAELTFDGEKLVPGKVEPYAPTTLDWLREELTRLHADAREQAQASGESMRRLTWLAGASVALNVVLVGGLFAARRRRA